MSLKNSNPVKCRSWIMMFEKAGVNARLRELGIELPRVEKSLGNYMPYVHSQRLLFISGQGPRGPDGQWLRGTVGADVSVKAAYEHARVAGGRLLSVAQIALGSLERVSRVYKVVGFVNAAPGFREHPAVINGCSDLLVSVFGERGRHARSAVGVGSLPEDITVEIEAILEVK